MIPNSILNALECALTKNQFKHFIVNPITMPCGHSACKSCILRLNQQPIKCLQCGNLNDIDVKNFGESYIVKCVVNAYIHDLFGVIFTEMKNTFEHLKSKFII